MVSTVETLSRMSAERVERSLAVLLIGLLGMYVLGTVSSTVVPVLDTVGVVAVHFAVVVAGVFPLAILTHATSSRIRTGVTGPRLLEVGTAAVAFGCLSTSLWIALDSASTLSTVLFGCAAGALLILVGLVAGRP